jgi:ABC-type multidrug transport system fused ATPase/permease subunit
MSGFSLLCLNYTVQKSRIFGKKIVEIRGNLSQQFFGVYDQLREIKVSKNGKFFLEQIENTTQNLFVVFLRSVKVGLVVRSLLTIGLISVSVFLIVQLKHANSLDLAILSTGLVMVMRLLPLVLNFTRIRQGFVAKSPFLSELENHLRNCAENPEAVGGQKVFRGLTSSIEFRGAEFSYPSIQGKALSQLNAVVNKGEATALVGASGAGKSTFVDCLPLLIELGSGMLLLDGENINSFSKESIRRHIAYVPQSPKLFDGPLWYNVSPSKFPNFETVIQDLLCEVGLGKLLASMPLGIETVVGDAGVKLSGGQIQRIALARAICTDATIFILDEPTSALDAENASRILNLIRELSAKKGATVLVISHAWDVISKLDKMIKLESGTAVYQGKPEYKVFAIECGSVKDRD